MKVMQGIANKISNVMHVSGEKNSITTAYITTFEIAGRPYRMKTSTPPIIGDGDEVMVAGSMSGNGLFYVHAYRNVSKKVLGSRATGVDALKALAIFVAGCIPPMAIPGHGGLFAFVLTIAFWCVAAYILYTFVNSVKALQLLKEVTTDLP